MQMIIIFTLSCFIANECQSALDIQKGSPGRDLDIYIATGTKIQQKVDGDIRGAAYKLDTVYQGQINTNVIIVLYFAEAEKSEPPTNALLLLWRDAYNVFRPIGDEAWRGLLELDDRRRELLEAGQIQTILDEAKSVASIDEDRVAEIVEQELIRAGIDLANLSTVRLSKLPCGGWTAQMMLDLSTTNVKAESLITIRIADDGHLLNFSEGKVFLREWRKVSSDAEE